MKLIDREVGPEHPLFLIAGPCVIESRDHCLMMAEKINNEVARAYISVTIFSTLLSP